MVAMTTADRFMGGEGNTADEIRGTARCGWRETRLPNLVEFREYWMVDPDRNSVAVYRRAADGTMPLATTLEAGNGEALTTALLPGWELPLGHFFRK